MTKKIGIGIILTLIILIIILFLLYKSLLMPDVSDGVFVKECERINYGYLY